MSSEIQAIFVRLDHQDETIGEVKNDVREILQHARLTNGRVTNLELDRAVRERLEADRQTRRASRLSLSKQAGLVILGGGIGLLPILLGGFSG